MFRSVSLFVFVLSVFFTFTNSFANDMPAPSAKNFMIFCMSGKQALECKDAQNVVDKFNNKYGANYAQMIDVSNDSAQDVADYMRKYSAYFGHIEYLMFLATHGYENRDYNGNFEHSEGTHFYWQCDHAGGDCKQNLSTKDLMNVALSNLKVAFFSDCITHTTSDDISGGYAMGDNTATSWVHLYSPKAISLGFTHPTNFPGTQDLTQCVWEGIADNIGATQDAKQLNNIVNSCKEKYPSSQIPGNDQILPGTLYFTGINTDELPVAKVQHIDVFQNPFENAQLMLNGQTVDLPMVTGLQADILEPNDFLSALGNVDQLINTRALSQIQLVVPGSEGNPPAHVFCRNDDDQVPSVQVPFSSQFNTLDIVVGGNMERPFCTFTYDYRTKH